MHNTHFDSSSDINFFYIFLCKNPTEAMHVNMDFFFFFCFFRRALLLAIKERSSVYISSAHSNIPVY